MKMCPHSSALKPVSMERPSLFLDLRLVLPVIFSVQSTDPVHVSWPNVIVFCGSRFHFLFMLWLLDAGGGGGQGRKVILVLIILQVLVAFPCPYQAVGLPDFSESCSVHLRVSSAFPGRAVARVDWRADFCKELWLRPQPSTEIQPLPGTRSGTTFPGLPCIPMFT